MLNDFEEFPLFFSFIKRYINYFERKEELSNEIKYFDLKDHELSNNKSFLEKMNKKQNEYPDYNEFNNFCIFDSKIYSNDQLELNETQISPKFETFNSQSQEKIVKTHTKLNEYNSQYYYFENIIGSLKKNLNKKIKILMDFLTNRFKDQIKLHKENYVKITKEYMRSILLNIILEKGANFLQYDLIYKIRKSKMNNIIK